MIRLETVREHQPPGEPVVVEFRLGRRTESEMHVYV